ncbi:hypothetical protein H0H93_005760 [Arthromyces matolae]|nr:hypothetical protein H0H93_005760 [Arthromyces matolae]
MSFTHTFDMRSTLIFLTVVFVLLPIETRAFGAGDIPDFSYLNDKAFRHGDIENILETLAKTAGGAAMGGGLMGFASSILQQATGGSKFTKSDVKKVYFGNWLRDYSQTFGFATEEFQVTADRTYRQSEVYVHLSEEVVRDIHTFNRGYAAKEGDARQYHPKLRPPVHPQELEIDPRTGMKNYMATEGRGWDTSTAFIRRTFRACIEVGRHARGRPGGDLWEAYRLLGTGLHTMEDLLAHSNWCEVALRKLGYREVFCHVGDNVIVNTPNGPAPPLVTGTFGGADFIYSLMGEATEYRGAPSKLSQASVTEITQKMTESGDSDGNFSKIKQLLSKLPFGGSNNDVEQGEEMNAAAKAYHFDPSNIAPAEVQTRLIQLLKWRDQVYRDVVSKIEMVPGLADLLDDLTNALNAYVYTILTPYVVPLLQQATGVLGEGSKSVIDSEDQYEVFDDPNASDPSHSFLSKVCTHKSHDTDADYRAAQDHFDLILNEPAGKIAQLVVENSVNLIVQAWGQDNNPDEVINQILEAFHHPYFANGHSEIQRKMFGFMDQWIGGMGQEGAAEIIRRLSKDSVRNARNKRPGSKNEPQDESPRYGSHYHGDITGYQSSGAQQGKSGPSKHGNTSTRYDDNSQYRGSSNDQYGAYNQYPSSSNKPKSEDNGSSINPYGSGARYGSSPDAHAFEHPSESSSKRYNIGRSQYASTPATYSSGNQSESLSSRNNTANQNEFSRPNYSYANQHGSSGNTGNHDGSSRNVSTSESQHQSHGTRHRQQNTSATEYESQSQHNSSGDWYRSGDQEDHGYKGRNDDHGNSAYGRQTHGQTDRTPSNNQYYSGQEGYSEGRGASYGYYGGIANEGHKHEERTQGGRYDENEGRSDINRGNFNRKADEGGESYGNFNEHPPRQSLGYQQERVSSNRYPASEREEHESQRRKGSNASEDHKEQRYRRHGEKSGQRYEDGDSYGRSTEGGVYQERSYGGFGYDGSDETYGVGRLRVDDSDDDEKKKKHGRHGHKHRDDSDSD